MVLALYAGSSRLLLAGACALADGSALQRCECQWNSTFWASALCVDCPVDPGLSVPPSGSLLAKTPAESVDHLSRLHVWIHRENHLLHHALGRLERKEAGNWMDLSWNCHGMPWLYHPYIYVIEYTLHIYIDCTCAFQAWRRLTLMQCINPPIFVFIFHLELRNKATILLFGTNAASIIGPSIWRAGLAGPLRFRPWCLWTCTLSWMTRTWAECFWKAWTFLSFYCVTILLVVWTCVHVYVQHCAIISYDVKLMRRRHVIQVIQHLFVMTALALDSSKSLSLDKHNCWHIASVALAYPEHSRTCLSRTLALILPLRDFFRLWEIWRCMVHVRYVHELCIICINYYYISLLWSKEV